MKTICVFAPNYDSFMRAYIVNIANSLSVKGCTDVVVYGVNPDVVFNNEVGVVVDSDLNYLYKNNDPRIYENFLKFAIDNKFDKIFIPRLSHPEYLYSELRLREINGDLILSIFAFELFSTSKARRELLADLICSEKISKVLVHSILGHHLKFPYDYRAAELNQKLHFVSEPLYEMADEYQDLDNKCLSTFIEKPVILYFGNMFFGKGVDLLIEASTIVTREMRIVIAGNFQKSNFEIPKVEFGEKSKIEIIDRYVDHEEMVSLFVNCDAVVLPYRKTYENGTSGVFVQSMLASKPVLVPDFYPFNLAIDLYSCGLTFEAGNVNDLARGLDEISDRNFDFKDGIRLYKSNLVDWDFFAEIIVA